MHVYSTMHKQAVLVQALNNTSSNGCVLCILGPTSFPLPCNMHSPLPPPTARPKLQSSRRNTFTMITVNM